MRRGVLLLITVVISILSVSLVSAQTCTLDVKAKSTDALIKELPAIDASLQNCPVVLGSPMNKIFKNDVVIVKLKEGVPWDISFSFSRALQTEAMEAWAGKDENIDTCGICGHDIRHEIHVRL